MPSLASPSVSSSTRRVAASVGAVELLESLQPAAREVRAAAGHHRVDRGEHLRPVGRPERREQLHLVVVGDERDAVLGAQSLDEEAGALLRGVELRAAPSIRCGR